jgi:predicted nucleic acid-binding protein
MASKIFLDANVLLNFTLKRENYDEARRLMQKIVSGQLNAYISPPIVHISGY